LKSHRDERARLGVGLTE
jgi:hypothetical protein